MKGRSEMLSLGLPFGWLWFWNLVSAGSWSFGEEKGVQKYSATLSLRPSHHGFSHPSRDRNRSWRSESSLSKAGWPELPQHCVFSRCGGEIEYPLKWAQIPGASSGAPENN